MPASASHWGEFLVCSLFIKHFVTDLTHVERRTDVNLLINSLTWMNLFSFAVWVLFTDPWATWNKLQNLYYARGRSCPLDLIDEWENLSLPRSFSVSRRCTLLPEIFFAIVSIVLSRIPTNNDGESRSIRVDKKTVNVWKCLPQPRSGTIIRTHWSGKRLFKKIWRVFNGFWYPCYAYPERGKCVHLRHKSRHIAERTLTLPAHSDSTIQHLPLTTDSLSLASDRIKLLIRNNISFHRSTMHTSLAPFLLRSAGCRTEQSSQSSFDRWFSLVTQWKSKIGVASGVKMISPTEESKSFHFFRFRLGLRRSV